MLVFFYQTLFHLAKYVPGSSTMPQVAAFSSFAWMNNIYIYHIFSVCLFAGRHLDGFNILVIENKAVMGIGVQISLWHSDFFSFGYTLRSGIITINFCLFTQGKYQSSQSY
jgi:hypothetical protein